MTWATPSCVSTGVRSGAHDAGGMANDSQLGRAARVLDFLAGQPAMGFSAIARALDGLNPASLSRLLKGMIDAGMLVAEEGGYRVHRRLATWQPGPDSHGWRQRVEAAMAGISQRHRVTVILLECRGDRLAPVAKCMHPDAPALMACGGSFAPRLAYFASILSMPLPPNAGLDWVRRQLADAPNMVDRSEKAGLQVLRHVQRHDWYRDAWLYPGQLRLAVAVRENDHQVGILGASGVKAMLDRKAEQALLHELRSCAVCGVGNG